MKTKTKQWRKILAVIVVLGLMIPAAMAVAGGAGNLIKNPLIAPPNSHAYGNTLTRWSTLYWQWYIPGADPAQSKVGDVQLMPIPVGEQTGGDISDPNNPAYFVGQLQITIPAGTPIVLPAFSLYYELYQDGSQDTPYPDADVLGSVHPALTIDGVVVLTDANKAAYYNPATYFDAPIFYPEPTPYGSVAAIFFQGVSVVIKPLAVGQHTIHLVEPWIFPPLWSLVYDNTWHVTVTP